MFIDFLQKTNQRIRLYCYDSSGPLVFVRFWRKLTTQKNHFEINWPLAGTLNWKLFVLWKHIVGLQKRKWFLHKKVAYATQICRKVSAVPLKIEAQITKLYKNNHFALFLQFSKLCWVKTHTNKKNSSLCSFSFPEDMKRKEK